MAGLLVTALLGLAEPTQSIHTTPVPTLSPTTVVWQTSKASAGPDSRERDEHDNKRDNDEDRDDHHHKDHDDEKRYDEKNDKDKEDDQKEERDSGKGNNDKGHSDKDHKDDREGGDQGESVLPAVGQLRADSTGCSDTVIESPPSLIFDLTTP
jgi:hypothetical protein